MRRRCPGWSIHRRVWSLESFAFLETVTEIEGIRPACNANLLQLVLFDGDLPGPAPTKGAKPNITGLLIVTARVVDGIPRIILIAGSAAATLEHFLPG